MSRNRRWVIGRIEGLPHWARVAFASRCARGTFPLYERSWVGVPSDRVASLAAALELAERSAAEGRPQEGLHAAEVAATIAAGAAQMGIYRFPNYEKAPTDERQARTACFAAKAVECAVKAADAEAGESSYPLEAYVWAHDSAEAAGEAGIIGRLHDDLAILSRAAARGRWTDRTPVPPEVFESQLGSSDDPRLWWKFW